MVWLQSSREALGRMTDVNGRLGCRFDQDSGLLSAQEDFAGVGETARTLEKRTEFADYVYRYITCDRQWYTRSA